MTVPIPTPPDPIEPIIPVHETENSFSLGVSSMFQATAPLKNLAKESIETGKDVANEIGQFGSNFVQNVGEVMAEPGKLFQPTKTISTLGALASVSVEGIKNLATDTMGLATGTIDEIRKTSSDFANVRTTPKTDGGVMQPARPLSELSNIGGKIIKSGTILASGTVDTGVNVAKKIFGAGTNLLKKGLGALKK